VYLKATTTPKVKSKKKMAQVARNIVKDALTGQEALSEITPANEISDQLVRYHNYSPKRPDPIFVNLEDFLISQFDPINEANVNKGQIRNLLQVTYRSSESNPQDKSIANEFASRIDRVRYIADAYGWLPGRVLQTRIDGFYKKIDGKVKGRKPLDDLELKFADGYSNNASDSELAFMIMTVGNLRYTMNYLRQSGRLSKEDADFLNGDTFFQYKIQPAAKGLAETDLYGFDNFRTTAPVATTRIRGVFPSRPDVFDKGFRAPGQKLGKKFNKAGLPDARGRARDPINHFGLEIPPVGSGALGDIQNATWQCCGNSYDHPGCWARLASESVYDKRHEPYMVFPEQPAATVGDAQDFIDSGIKVGSIWDPDNQSKSYLEIHNQIVEDLGDVAFSYISAIQETVRSKAEGKSSDYSGILTDDDYSKMKRLLVGESLMRGPFGARVGQPSENAGLDEWKQFINSDIFGQSEVVPVGIGFGQPIQIDLKSFDVMFGRTRQELWATHGAWMSTIDKDGDRYGFGEILTRDLAKIKTVYDLDSDMGKTLPRGEGYLDFTDELNEIFYPVQDYVSDVFPQKWDNSLGYLLGVDDKPDFEAAGPEDVGLDNAIDNLLNLRSRWIALRDQIEAERLRRERVRQAAFQREREAERQRREREAALQRDEAERQRLEREAELQRAKDERQRLEKERVERERKEKAEEEARLKAEESSDSIKGVNDEYRKLLPGVKSLFDKQISSEEKQKGENATIGVSEANAFTVGESEENPLDIMANVSGSVLDESIRSEIFDYARIAQFAESTVVVEEVSELVAVWSYGGESDSEVKEIDTSGYLGQPNLKTAILIPSKGRLTRKFDREILMGVLRKYSTIARLIFLLTAKVENTSEIRNLKLKLIELNSGKIELSVDQQSLKLEEAQRLSVIASRKAAKEARDKTRAKRKLVENEDENSNIQSEQEKAEARRKNAATAAERKRASEEADALAKKKLANLARQKEEYERLQKESKEAEEAKKKAEEERKNVEKEKGQLKKAQDKSKTAEEKAASAELEKDLEEIAQLAQSASELAKDYGKKKKGLPSDQQYQRTKSLFEDIRQFYVKFDKSKYEFIKDLGDQYGFSDKAWKKSATEEEEKERIYNVSGQKGRRYLSGYKGAGERGQGLGLVGLIDLTSQLLPKKKKLTEKQYKDITGEFSELQLEDVNEDGYEYYASLSDDDAIEQRKELEEAEEKVTQAENEKEVAKAKAVVEEEEAKQALLDLTEPMRKDKEFQQIVLDRREAEEELEEAKKAEEELEKKEAELDQAKKDEQKQEEKTLEKMIGLARNLLDRSLKNSENDYGLQVTENESTVKALVDIVNLSILSPEQRNYINRSLLLVGFAKRTEQGETVYAKSFTFKLPPVGKSAPEGVLIFVEDYKENYVEMLNNLIADLKLAKDKKIDEVKQTDDYSDLGLSFLSDIAEKLFNTYIKTKEPEDFFTETGEIRKEVPEQIVKDYSIVLADALYATSSLRNSIVYQMDLDDEISAVIKNMELHDENVQVKEKPDIRMFSVVTTSKGNVKNYSSEDAKNSLGIYADENYFPGTYIVQSAAEVIFLIMAFSSLLTEEELPENILSDLSKKVPELSNVVVETESQRKTYRDGIDEVDPVLLELFGSIFDSDIEAKIQSHISLGNERKEVWKKIHEARVKHGKILKLYPKFQNLVVSVQQACFDSGIYQNVKTRPDFIAARQIVTNGIEDLEKEGKVTHDTLVETTYTSLHFK